MEMHEEIKDDVLVLKIHGELMGGEEIAQLQNRFMVAIEEGCPQIIVDMADVKWMNSSGLGSLMAGLTTLRGSGGDLKLVHVPDRVRRPIEITKLDQVIKIYENLDDAVASFEEGE